MIENCLFNRIPPVPLLREDTLVKPAKEVARLYLSL